MKIHDFEQGTPEWLSIRLGKFTATNGQAVATAGRGLDTLCFEKASEIITKMPSKEPYTNADMERGNEFESLARANYELIMKRQVKQMGFCEMDEWVGCSPDGLVGDDGLVEIKCQSPKVYVKTKYEGKPASGYMWQMQYQMYVTDRKWCDFVVFNENFVDIINFRIERDEKKISKIVNGLNVGITKVKTILERFNV